MERVAFGRTAPDYNRHPPFHPSARYPEARFSQVSDLPNGPYELARELLRRLGYDAANYGNADWNPLGTLIKPGQTVVIKPNFVVSVHRQDGELFSVVTHPSVLRVMVDYAFLALRGEGRIVIADAPQMDCDWDQLMQSQRLDTIQEFYRRQFGFDLEVYDLRNFALVDPRSPAYAGNRKPLAGDPAGSVVVDLGRQSAFYGLPCENYYGADYDRSVTIRHHSAETHEYCVSRTILGADAVISVPKMKVHSKVGVTLNLKGLVGVNTDKNYLVHYRVGTPSRGGDQLPDDCPAGDLRIFRAQRWLFDHALAKQTRLGDLIYKIAFSGYNKFVKPVRGPRQATVAANSGNWHGNDSAWRMTVDLAKVIQYADAAGQLRTTPQRAIFCLVDGILGGEKNGPLVPTAKPSGCLVAGSNPWTVDLTAARLMGFDVRKLKIFTNAYQDFVGDEGEPSHDLKLLTDDGEIEGASFFSPHNRDPLLAFEPPSAWTSHIEIGGVPVAGRAA